MSILHNVKDVHEYVHYNEDVHTKVSPNITPLKRGITFSRASDAKTRHMQQPYIGEAAHNTGNWREES